MNKQTSALAVCLAALATVTSACAPDGAAEAAAENTAEADSALSLQAFAGKVLFDAPLPHTNGRSCATCHVESEHLALSPAHVAARFSANPQDPLFNRMDADDPAAAVPTYAHLRAGLVRVTLPLADNLDLVDAAGNVVTNAARTISVWRGVPTVENTAYTAPYQLDGRSATLEDQAIGALHAHSQISVTPPPAVGQAIAAYERTAFSGPRAAHIAEELAEGETPDNLEPHFPPGSAEAAGQALFLQGCAPCHGGPQGNQIVNQAVHDQAFPVLNADGSASISVLPDGTVVPAAVRHDVADHHAINTGISVGGFLAQVGGFPNFNGVDAPHYRVRFYTDATRTGRIVDLPPPPPATGPTGQVQAYSVDPGRAILTGDLADWEAFDVPQLRGIKNTAPYFHNNLVPDLMSVLDTYSRFILPAFPQLGLPRVVAPAAPGLPPESFTVTQKQQLIAYLNRI
jgi:cytochrome c peroxidase